MGQFIVTLSSIKYSYKLWQKQFIEYWQKHTGNFEPKAEKMDETEGGEKGTRPETKVPRDIFRGF